RANAMLGNSGATPRAYEEWACARLLDFACAPGVVGRSNGEDELEHEQRIRTLEAVAEMCRYRRTQYGKHWVAAAREAVLSARWSTISTFSPSRGRAYILAASPIGERPRPDQLNEEVRRAM